MLGCFDFPRIPGLANLTDLGTILGTYKIVEPRPTKFEPQNGHRSETIYYNTLFILSFLLLILDPNNFTDCHNILQPVILTRS